jgi:hypothetical protein
MRCLDRAAPGTEMKTLISNICFLAGLGVIAYGGWLIAEWVGMIVLGAGLLAVAVLTEMSVQKSPQTAHLM